MYCRNKPGLLHSSLTGIACQNCSEALHHTKVVNKSPAKIDLTRDDSPPALLPSPAFQQIKPKRFASHSKNRDTVENVQQESIQKSQAQKIKLATPGGYEPASSLVKPETTKSLGSIPIPLDHTIELWTEYGIKNTGNEDVDIPFHLYKNLGSTTVHFKDVRIAVPDWHEWIFDDLLKQSPHYHEWRTWNPDAKIQRVYLSTDFNRGVNCKPHLPAMSVMESKCLKDFLDFFPKGTGSKPIVLIMELTPVAVEEMSSESDTNNVEMHLPSLRGKGKARTRGNPRGKAHKKASMVTKTVKSELQEDLELDKVDLSQSCNKKRRTCSDTISELSNSTDKHSSSSKPPPSKRRFSTRFIKNEPEELLKTPSPEHEAKELLTEFSPMIFPDGGTDTPRQ